MVARYSVAEHSFRVDKPELWAERAPRLRESLSQRMYALHPDGKRVVIAPPSDDDLVAQTHLTFVLHFTDELRRIAPARR